MVKLIFACNDNSEKVDNEAVGEYEESEWMEWWDEFCDYCSDEDNWDEEGEISVIGDVELDWESYCVRLDVSEWLYDEDDIGDCED